MAENMLEIDYNKHYQRLHQFSDEYYKVMEKSYRQFFKDLLPPSKSARILDIGCGTGFALNAIRNAGYENAIGIDADRTQVELARQRHLPVEHVPAEQTAEYLSSLQEPLQMVLLIDVLEHVEKDCQIPFLRQIRSSLAPQGRLLCQVPNALWILAVYNRYMDWTHHCLFSVESLAFVLENAGYDVETIRASHDRPSPPRGYLLSVAIPAARLLLKGITNAAWRAFTVANLGPKGLTHPVTANLLAVAKRP